MAELGLECRNRSHKKSQSLSPSSCPDTLNTQPIPVEVCVEVNAAVGSNHRELQNGGIWVLTGGAVVGQWVVVAESGVCQVNDTSADFGWWGTVVSPKEHEVPLQSGQGYHLEAAFPAVALELLTCWACVQHKCSVCVCLCLRSGLGANCRLPGTFSVMIVQGLGKKGEKRTMNTKAIV